MKRSLTCSEGAFVATVLIALALVRGTAFAQSTPNPAAIVKTSTLVSLDPVPRGQPFEAAVVIQIQPGYHMNSHTPSEDYLIPTTITPNAPAGITIESTGYPDGQLKTFTFSPNKPLSVYSDNVTLRIKLTVGSSVGLGPLSIPATLRYQACNDKACLPPVKIPVTVNANIAAAGAKARRVNPDIFPAKP